MVDDRVQSNGTSDELQSNEATTPDPTFDINNPPFPLTKVDLALLRTPDRLFHSITWPDLRRIISANTLEDLKRRPTDLKRYLAWSHDTKARYRSITAFVVQERLKWNPVDEENLRFDYASVDGMPFQDERDYAILRNDWPYGLEAGIEHLLVWSKVPISVDAERGDVTVESRERIVQFVERVFVRALAQDGDMESAWQRVLWFKNWVSLQSVRGVDHVHILVKDAPREVLERWLARQDL